MEKGRVVRRPPIRFTDPLVKEETDVQTKKIEPEPEPDSLIVPLQDNIINEISAPSPQNNKTKLKVVKQLWYKN